MLCVFMSVWSSSSSCVWLNSAQICDLLMCEDGRLSSDCLSASCNTREASSRHMGRWCCALHQSRRAAAAHRTTHGTMTPPSAPPAPLTTPAPAQSSSNMCSRCPAQQISDESPTGRARGRRSEAAAAAWRIHWAATLQSFLLTHPNQQGRDTTTQVAHTEVCPPNHFQGYLAGVGRVDDGVVHLKKLLNRL